ncbi:nicotinate-nucleotide--dimethylbenzimidazole phosphoribosyltransferase [Streptomyces sp. G45]|uniref:nicotinate-nucleotide--dimethylbenzimidazole phosphoribosyltransferase n=1 Tax=Streptomyces sp. G45 TaxID=3406627 RepID=UPI003C210F65
MTDTGQVPGEGLPENAGMVEQPGIPAPGAYAFLDPSENPADDDDLLLMPGAQGAWSETQGGQAGVAQPLAAPAQVPPQAPPARGRGRQAARRAAAAQAQARAQAGAVDQSGAGQPGGVAQGAAHPQAAAQAPIAQDGTGQDAMRQDGMRQDTAGQMPVDQVLVDQVPVDQLAVGQVPVDQMPVDQVPVDQVPVNQAHVGQAQPGQVATAQAQAAPAQPGLAQPGPADAQVQAAPAQGPAGQEPGGQEGFDQAGAGFDQVPNAQVPHSQTPNAQTPNAQAVADPAAMAQAQPGPTPADPAQAPPAPAGHLPAEQAPVAPGAQPDPGAAPVPAEQDLAAHQPGPHETAGRDSGSVDLTGTGLHGGPAHAPAAHHGAARRPLHRGPAAPAVPNAAASPVRSLADRGPAGGTPHAVPVRNPGPPTSGPEYLDVPRDDAGVLPGPQLGEIPPQPAAPWTPQPQESLPPHLQAAPHAPQGLPAETVVPETPEIPHASEASHASEAPHATPAPQATDEPDAPADTPIAPADTPEAVHPEAAAPAPEASPAHAQPVAHAPEAEGPESASDAPDATAAPDATTAPAPHAPAAPAQEAVPAPAADGTPVPNTPAETRAPGAPDADGSAPDAPDAYADEIVIAPQPLAADVTPQAPDAAQPWPGAHTPQGPHLAAPGAEGAVPGQHFPEPPAPLGQFVPVEGSVPTTPHLAPTPPRPLAVPQELFDAPQPGAEQADAAAQETGDAASAPAPVLLAPDALPDAAAQAAPEAPDGAEGTTVPTVPAPRDGERPPAAPAPDAASVSTTDGQAPPAPEAADPDEPMHAPHPAEPTDPAPQADEVPTPDPAAPVEPPAADPAEPTGLPEPLTVIADGADGTEDPEAPGAPVQGDASDLAEPLDPEADATPLDPPAPAYADAEREAVLRVMRERRDIRNGFRSDPIPHDVLLRVLEAAHTAPSVGHSQPWDFVVIRSADTRRTMHELAQRQREAYAKSLPKGRAKQFKELKIEAILDTPVNIVVTADPTRGGRHTLGRHTQPQMAPYSSALAVENLWLAARAEGLGVGWVSFFDEREMVRALGLPEHLEVVAYLCVGYVDEFPDEPELMQAGWSKRRPLSWVVHEETYGRRALPGEDPHDLLAETVGNIRPLDAKALGEAWERQKRMTKPAGALGMLEIISAQLSGLSRMCPPPIPEPAAVAIFAGDHGVHAQGVTSWPQEVTGQMVANFLGGGAVCNAFANQVGAEVCVIDVGVASELPATPGLLPRKVRAGTADMTTGPALTREEVKAAIEVGIETARDLVAAGNKALLTGEMGIANTTASAALISVYTDTDPAEVTGRGTGINDEMHARKVEVVRRALDLHEPDPADPIGVLAAIGGLEHAAMVGLLLGGASLRTPVILDGVSAGAAALVARAIAPEVLAACIAGHRSAEPGHVAALNKLGLRPLVDLDLRLGEGTGALLALPVVQSAARAMHEVATFDSAGVTEK